MKRDITVIASEFGKAQPGYNNIAIKLMDVDIPDLLNEIGESTIEEWLDSKGYEVKSPD